MFVLCYYLNYLCSKFGVRKCELSNEVLQNNLMILLILILKADINIYFQGPLFLQLP